ncbi:MAG TPA: A/G-specific adenine glycosylase [Thermoanaerobaculia bacterium]|nr:A/G-specific adenine glycosylase [Thermoanaerobaculia bacterium]
MPDQPGRIAESIEFWFDRHQRPLPWRLSYDPYLVWVSEVMLQQTRMEVVLRYFSPFVTRFPEVRALAAASEEEVLAAWSGLGYYRRARMLHAGARDVVERFGGVIPADPDSLQTIAGIGRYTAGAIASIAWRQRAAIVDGNVARVASRLFAIEAAVGSRELMAAAWSQAAGLVEACSDPRALNQGLMEIGALVCTPQKPDCVSCPVRDDCRAWATGRASTLPFPKERRVATRMIVPLYLIDDGRGRFLMRRERGALMTSMLHLPHGSNALLGGRVLSVVERELIGSFRHTITTRNIEFRLHRADLREIADSGEYEWVDPDSLAQLPHPSYVAKAVALARA